MKKNRTMENKEIKMMILDRLAEVEATHTYAFAIRDDKMVKAAIVEGADDIMSMITVCERNAKSHGGVYGIRMWNSKDAFNIIKEYARELVTISSVKQFEADYKEAKENGFVGNRGNFFEVKFSAVTGAIMNENPTAKCIDCGDVNWNGEEIQLKLWNATVTTEPQINRFYEMKMKESE